MSRCAGFLALLGGVALIPVLVHGDPGTASPPACAHDPSGDPLPAAARLRLGTIRLRHGGSVTSLRYLPDGKTLLSYGSDQMLHFWDAATGKELHSVALQVGNQGQVWSSWDIQVQLNARFSIQPNRQTSNWSLSQDGRLLATVDGATAIQVRDVLTGKPAKPIKLEQGNLQYVLFSPSGAQLAAIVQLPLANGGSEGAIKIWDVATGKELRTLQGPKPEQEGQQRFTPYSFAFAPDGKALLALGNEFNASNRVRIWDLTAANKESVRLIEHNGTSNVFPVFAPDGKTLADVSVNPITGGNARLRLWDTATGKQVRELAEVGNGASQLLFSPDGKTLAAVNASNNQALHLYDLASGKELFNVAGNGGVPLLVFAPDGKTLAVGTTEQTIRLLDARTGKEQHLFKGTQPYNGNTNQDVGALGQALAFSTDGQMLAAASGTVIRRWSVETGKEHPLPGSGHEAGINAVVLTPDGKTVVTAGQDGIRLWDAATGALQRRLPETEMKDVVAVQALCCAADGKTLLAGQADGAIVRYDLASGKVLQEYKGHESTIAALAVTASGKLFFSAAYDGRVFAWDAATAKPVRQFAGTVPGGEASAENVSRGLALLALAPDEATLAISGTDGLRTAETATAKTRRQLISPPQPQPMINYQLSPFQTLDSLAFVTEYSSALAFSPEGRILAASSGATIQLWDALRGKQLRQLGGQNGSIRHLAFTPNGKVLAAASDEGSIRFWEVATGTVIAHVDGHRGGIAGLAFSADGQTLVSAGYDTTGLVWDVKRCLENAPAGKPTARTVAALWDRLALDDALKAGDAVADLIDHPDLAVPLLRDRLQPVPTLNKKRVAALLGDLEAGSFDARKKANEELEKLVELAESALQGRLDENPPLEVKMRLERLLEKARGPVTLPENARALRAVQVLEHIGSADARQVLERLAGGAAESRVTRSAQEALRRLDR